MELENAILVLKNEFFNFKSIVLRLGCLELLIKELLDCFFNFRQQNSFILYGVFFKKKTFVHLFDAHKKAVYSFNPSLQICRYAQWTNGADNRVFF